MKGNQLCFSPRIMGIVNVTPDSFSDGGRFVSISAAADYACELFRSGVDIIDIGGESSRPNAEPVSQQEEIDRTIPVVEKVIAQVPEAYISIDTYRAETAKLALQAGAKMVNDISGGRLSEDMVQTVALHKAAYVIMHMLGTPKTMQNNPEYTDVVREVISHLRNRAKLAADSGVTEIIIDPGIGFGKTVEHNFALLQATGELKKAGYPVLIGVSRKSFIGTTLQLEVSERDAATAMLEMYALTKGADIIRTHNCTNGVQLKKLFMSLQHG